MRRATTETKEKMNSGNCQRITNSAPLAHPAHAHERLSREEAEDVLKQLTGTSQQERLAVREPGGEAARRKLPLVVRHHLFLLGGVRLLRQQRQGVITVQRRAILRVAQLLSRRSENSSIPL